MNYDMKSGPGFRVRLRTNYDVKFKKHFDHKLNTNFLLIIQLWQKVQVYSYIILTISNYWYFYLYHHVTI